MEWEENETSGGGYDVDRTRPDDDGWFSMTPEANGPGIFNCPKEGVLASRLMLTDTRPRLPRYIRPANDMASVVNRKRLHCRRLPQVLQ